MIYENYQALKSAHELIAAFLALVSKGEEGRLLREFNISPVVMSEIREYLSDYFGQVNYTLSPAPLQKIITGGIDKDLFFMPGLEEDATEWRISCRIFSSRGEEEISGNFDLIFSAEKYMLEYLYFSC